MQQNKIVAFLLVIFLTVKCFSQQEELSKFYIKISPTTLLEPTGGVQVGAEYLLFSNVSIQQEIAYLNSQSSICNLVYKSYIEGFRTNSEIRFYFKNFQNQNQYFATNINIKKTSQPKQVSIDYYDGAYAQLFNITKTKSVFAFHLKFGNQITFENSPICIDYFIGIGYRHLTIDRTGIDKGIEVHEFEYNTRSLNGVYNSPSLSGGIKIGLRVF